MPLGRLLIQFWLFLFVFGTFQPADDDVAQESPLKFLTFPVTVQPANFNGVLGGNAVFHAAFSIPGGTAVTYHWQIKLVLTLPDSSARFLVPDGVNVNNVSLPTKSTPDVWNDLTEIAGLYEGVSTDTLTVKAIDNFLCDPTAAQVSGAYFRLRVVRNAVPQIPSFTSPAKLIVPNCFVWWPAPAFYYDTQFFAANTPPMVFTFKGPALSAINTLSSPISYLWSFVSGSADIVCNNPVDPNAVPFEYVGTTGIGIVTALWTLSATDGVTTITSQPLKIVVHTPPLPIAESGYYNINYLPIAPTRSGTPINVDLSAVPGAQFVSYGVIAQQNTRWPAAPVVSLVDPTDPASAFSGITPTTQPAGTFVSALFGANTLVPVFSGQAAFFYPGQFNGDRAGFIPSAPGLGSYFYRGLVDPFAP